MTGSTWVCWRRRSGYAIRTVGGRKSRPEPRFSLRAPQTALRSAPRNALISIHIFSSSGKVGLESRGHRDLVYYIKEEFDHPRKSPLSATNYIDRSAFFSNPLATPHCRPSRKLPSAARGIDRDVAWSDRIAASDRITASFAGDLPRVSRAIWTAPREAERTRRACGIRTQ